jgi:GNAT acetyltransferase-like protein
MSEIGFRRMTPDDLALVAAWLAEPHVGPWWKPSEIDDVTRAVHGDEPVEPWLCVLDGNDVG